VKEWLYTEDDVTLQQIEEKLTSLKESVQNLAPAFHDQLVKFEDDRKKVIEAAAEERRKKELEPHTTSSRNKDEKPLTKQEKFEAVKKRKNH